MYRPANSGESITVSHDAVLNLIRPPLVEAVSRAVA
jgi:hypothetical protein